MTSTGMMETGAFLDSRKGVIQIVGSFYQSHFLGLDAWTFLRNQTVVSSTRMLVMMMSVYVVIGTL